MADQNLPPGRRPHYHRGRRGQDRRGGERRAPQHTHETSGSRDHVDVEQIMRDIRARISQRHGIELSNQQIQELAARRLDAILEPRNVKPSLLAQLRRSAGEPVELPPAATTTGYTFDERTLYSSGSGLVRAIRGLLRPILALFFDPKPIAEALHAQARLNTDAAARDAARDATQAEWNALHYEILQRLVTEVSRVSLEMQALSMRVEALGTKIDFNERRVRSFEQSFHQARPVTSRSTESGAQMAASASGAPAGTEGVPTDSGSDERRRRRRRRRGRRGGVGMSEGVPATSGAPGSNQEPEEFEDGDEGEPGNGDSPAVIATDAEAVVSQEPAIAMSPLQPPEAHAANAPSAADAAAPPAGPDLPTQPAPPRDEPVPPAPVDHTDQGPQDR